MSFSVDSYYSLKQEETAELPKTNLRLKTKKSLSKALDGQKRNKFNFFDWYRHYENLLC